MQLGESILLARGTTRIPPAERTRPDGVRGIPGVTPGRVRLSARRRHGSAVSRYPAAAPIGSRRHAEDARRLGVQGTRPGGPDGTGPAGPLSGVAECRRHDLSQRTLPGSDVRGRPVERGPRDRANARRQRDGLRRRYSRRHRRRLEEVRRPPEPQRCQNEQGRPAARMAQPRRVQADRRPGAVRHPPEQHRSGAREVSDRRRQHGAGRRRPGRLSEELLQRGTTPCTSRT